MVLSGSALRGGAEVTDRDRPGGVWGWEAVLWSELSWLGYTQRGDGVVVVEMVEMVEMVEVVEMGEVTISPISGEGTDGRDGSDAIDGIWLRE